MDLVTIFKEIQDSGIGTYIRESNWFPIVEGTHVLGLSLSLGLLLVSDLRLMGVMLRKRPVSRLWRQLLPWMITGFIIMFVSGGFLFWSQAFKAYHSIFFRTKIILLILAAANAAVYHLTIYRHMDQWDTATVPPVQARLAGLFSIILWAGIIATGRTMAYTF